MVPLVVGCGTAAVDAVAGGGERLEVEALCWVATDVLLLDLLVEPTSLRKRLFIDDMKTCRAALAQRQRQMHTRSRREERKWNGLKRISGVSDRSCVGQGGVEVDRAVRVGFWQALQGASQSQSAAATSQAALDVFD